MPRAVRRADASRAPAIPAGATPNPQPPPEPDMDACPCGSNLAYADCCAPLIAGARTAATAEALMRARYSAYAKGELAYLKATMHPDHRDGHDEKSTRDWSLNSQWHGLTILGVEGGGEGDEAGTVEFAADYTHGGTRRRHHELATFRRADGVWYLEGGELVKPKPVVRETPKIGRNDDCPCGSGRKYKKCCGR